MLPRNIFYRLTRLLVITFKKINYLSIIFSKIKRNQLNFNSIIQFSVGSMSKRCKDAIIDVGSSKRKRTDSPVTAKSESTVKTEKMGLCQSKKRKVDKQLSTAFLPDSESSAAPTRAVRKPRTVRNKSPVPSVSSTSESEASLICLSSLPTSANDWNSVDYVRESTGISSAIAQVVLTLFESENTIPFIARYRRAQTHGLDADILRLIKESYEKSKQVKQKADNVIKAIEKSGKWTPELHNFVRSVKSINELEQIHSLFKETSKRSHAEKARDLGLGPAAQAVIDGDRIANFRKFINRDKEGLKDEEEIKEGVVCILADLIVKDKRVFDERIALKANYPLEIQTTETKSSEKNNDPKRNEKLKTYQMYLDWKMSERNVKPHHILAINRAESEKIISVKCTLSDRFENLLLQFVIKLFPAAFNLPLNRELLTAGFKRAFKNSIKPTIIRRARAEMSEKAEEASMDVFAINVKQKLLSAPVRGKIVLGLDPGFTAGVKMAVVSVQGDVLETATIYPHKSEKLKRDAKDLIVNIVKKHKCQVIALGNATACRETEAFLSELIKNSLFSSIDVEYTIVDEAGASVYSCGTEAKVEFPGMDYNVISAVSIARRLQDPLAEYVKVDPKSLGVGMYQHSLPEKKLIAKLDEVIMEAVSFVGVDVNTASQCLLRRVAGLSDKKAANIIQYRKENGPFLSREAVKKVSAIGPKTFEQCAGFIRIMPETATVSSKIKSPKGGRTPDEIKKFNLLDQTWIHPESYKIAREFISACGIDLKNLGSREFISAVNIFCGHQGISVLAKRFKTDETTLEVIVKSLNMKKGEDIRSKNNAPAFRKSVRSIDDLTVGCLLSGIIRNVVHFGAFVDIGVGKDGLIHSKNLDRQELTIGQKVDVKVQQLDKQTKRIGLLLITAH